MKKDWHVAIFTLIYVISFTLIYTLGYIGIDYFTIILLLFISNNAPSLILVLLLLAFERIKKKSISEYIYLCISFLTISILLYDWKSTEYEFGNYFYPIFKESVWVLIAICLCSHLLAFFGFNIIKKLANKYAT